MKTRSHPHRPPAPAATRPQDPLADALQLHQAGRIQDARLRYEQLLPQRPRDAALLRLLGAALCQLQEPQRGRDYLGQSLALAPGHVETLLNLGKVCGHLKDFEPARQAFAEAARREPGNLEAHFGLASVASDLDEHAPALGHYVRVLEIDPRHQAAWRGAGYSALHLEQLDDALAFYRQAIALDARDTLALANRGLIHVRQGRHDEALRDYEAALAIDPGSALAWNNRAICLKELGRADEAMACLERALQLQPDYADAWCNRANTELVLGRPHEALASYDRALALKPAHLDARFNRSMSLMQVGRLAQGQAEYETRWLRRGKALPFPPARLWLGDQPIAGKRLLIAAEQGLGDSLQFCRYALLARAHGAQVILQVHKPLMRLMRSLPADITLVPMGEEPPPYDLACPLMSLPHAFRTELPSIPAPIPYLSAEPALAQAWRERLGEGDALKVGLVWSGGFRQDQPELWAVNQRRNLPLEQLAPLALPGVRFISLQKGEEGEAQLRRVQAEGWDGPAIEDPTASLGDFADTAALVENLDLVISVDTSTAHLAAAMGKPTWILSRLDGCWRWLLEREDSPWYPTARLYRQQRALDWAPVVARVRDDLARLVASREQGR